MKKAISYILTAFISMASLSANTGVIGEREQIANHLKGNSIETFDLYMLAGSGRLDINDAKAEFDEFILDLGKKKEKLSDARFLERVFFLTHRKYLKSFEAFSSFYDLVNNGTYNCLTATAYYGLILDQFGYDYQIVVDTYHTYLKVNLENGTSVLMESTDAINGFVDSQEDISRLLARYEQMELEGNGWDRTFSSQLSLTEMVGLQYYNLAINSYNQGDVAQAYQNLKKGMLFYQSGRMDALMMKLVDHPEFDSTERAIILNSLIG